MFTLQKLLDKTGLSFLFKAPVDEDKERQQILEWINYYVGTLIEIVDKDIETEKLGFYPHPENQEALNSAADSLGYLRYIIEDKSGPRLELSQYSLISCNSIKMTENYRSLKSKINDAGYTLELKEIDIDGDGVETFEDIDEHFDEFERYFVIHVSGW